MEKLFDELFTQIELLKKHEQLCDPRRRDGSYSRLDLAAYHLATCKNLLESVSKAPQPELTAADASVFDDNLDCNY